MALTRSILHNVAISVALSMLFMPTSVSAFSWSEIRGWFNDALPKPGSTLKEELRCYALPYGGIGFTSHILTYYTVCMLSAGRSPWRWKKNTHWRFDTFLAIATLVWTSGATVFTMIRCRGRWQFVLLAVWKLTMSMTLSAMGANAALIVRKKQLWDLRRPGHSKDSGPHAGVPLISADGNGNDGGADLESENQRQQGRPGGKTQKDGTSTASIWKWAVLYSIGILIGYVGLFSLVREAWQSVRTVRILTGVYIGLTVLLTILGFFFEESKGAVAIFLLFLATGILAALFSDWILAAIADNYAGVPDGNNSVLYWSYFVAKRLQILSF